MSWQVGVIRVVVGILVRGNTLLVAERPTGKPYSGYWELPGGKIEAHETGHEALQRELREELGVEVQAATYLCTHEHTYPDKTVHLEVWCVDAFQGEPHGLEGQVLQWVTLPEMKVMNILEGNWPILDQIAGVFNRKFL